MSDPKPRGPVVIELEAAPEPTSRGTQRSEGVNPAAAPPVPDHDENDRGQAMVAATRIAARPASWLARLFWSAFGALILIWLGAAAWDFATGLIARNVWLGRAVLVLGAVVLLAVLAFVIRELAGMSRLARIDGLRRIAEELRDSESDPGPFLDRLTGLYRGRDDVEWALRDLAKHGDAVMDPSERLNLAERVLMTPLDSQARVEVEKAARQVAAVTAIVPLAMADVVAALAANTRMIRRIAEIYGGRSGTFGSWRLFRAVATHLLATSAVGIADDMIGSVAGGGALAKLSRRFGEGIVNGALTARVGVAAMEICRPMPFRAQKRPGVTEIVGSSLSGLFSRSKD